MLVIHTFLIKATRQFSTGTKFSGGGKARAGKNSFPPTPFLFAHPSLKVFQNSAFGFSLKKSLDFVQRSEHNKITSTSAGYFIIRLEEARIRTSGERVLSESGSSSKKGSDDKSERVRAFSGRSGHVSSAHYGAERARKSHPGSQ